MTKNWNVQFLLILFLLGIPEILAAQEKRAPTLAEALSLKLINSPSISPDARYIAYRLRETNWKDNEFVSQLWLVNTATGASFQLTRGKKSAGAAEWSPDGHWLAFVTERESNAIEPKPAEKPADRGKGRIQRDAKKEDSDGDGKPAEHQIWLISPAGGEAWQLTKSETDVDDFHWSKDGKSIASPRILRNRNPAKTARKNIAITM